MVERWILTGLTVLVMALLVQGGWKTTSDGHLPAKKTVSTDGVTIVYTALGRGEPALVFIHGGFADRSFWTNQFVPFQKTHRVIAVDLAGHGDSGHNRTEWAISGFAQDVRAVLEKEKVHRAVLIGNSMGGPVAAETALIVPTKVVGIVAVDTFQVLRQPPQAEAFYRERAQAYRTDFKGAMQQMARALFHPDVDPALYARVEKTMLKGSPTMAAALMESFSTYDMVGSVKKLHCPIRCINGDLYKTEVEQNRTIYPDFAAVILPHTGHYPMLEKPELFNQHLTKIVQELTGK